MSRRPKKQESEATVIISPDIPWGFAEWFLIGQTAIPAILYFPGTQAFRIVVRTGAFAGSLFAFLYWVNKSRTSDNQHPSVKWLSLAMAFLGLMIFHPKTNSFLAGAAQFGLYLAVLAPVFWAPMFVGSAKQLHRLLWVLLVCNGINSIVGILQVHDPATWMPKELSSVVTQGTGLGNYLYRGPNGQQIIRPPGLFDAPGAVCGPGMLAGFLGIALFLSEEKIWRKLLALGLSFAGIAVIYLTLVRTNLLILGGMLVLLAVLQQLGGSKVRGLGILALAAGLGLSSFFLARQLGGVSIEDRVLSLTAQRPDQLFYNSRGGSVENGFVELLPEYPFGAGLGRWGMIVSYFGSETQGEDSGGFFTEIMFSAWIIDGGIILLVLYCGAIVVALKNDFAISRSIKHAELGFLAGCILASNTGIVAMCFSFVPFCAQIGLQFWFLTGALHGLSAGFVGVRIPIVDSTSPKSNFPSKGRRAVVGS